MSGATGSPGPVAGHAGGVAELVAQEQSGTRPRLTGKQVAALVGVKERRAQVLLREFRTNNNQGAITTAIHAREEGIDGHPAADP